MATPRFELTRIPIVKRALASRWLQWSLIAVTLPIVLLAILTGFFGTPVGSRNFGIVFVWIVWWALLILLMLPFAGRLWCAICPLPAPGEWLQRRALIQPRAGGKLYTLGWKWSPRLKNIWLQNASFLAVALFSVVILTTPLVSALVLALFAIVALGASVLFERRTFCRYLCPVGGFIGLYAQLAPVEIRVKDRTICASHKEKTCYVGSAAGYGCPWLVFPGALDKNTYCGMCTECFKTCPLDNVALYARPFGADLATNKGRKLDEAYKAFIMLTCALVYSIVLIGPWSILKETAYTIGAPGWWLYALVFLALNLVIVPGIFFACAALSNVMASHNAAQQFSARDLHQTWTRRASGSNRVNAQLHSRKISTLFVAYAYALVPLGLAAWAAFSVSFVLVNFSYAWQALSDPFGWGWNLFGAANWKWAPYLAGWQSALQIPILLGGLFGAIAIAFRTAREHHAPPRAALPIVAFCVAFTLILIGLYV